MDQAVITQHELQQIKSLLHWYKDAGISCLCSNKLQNRLEITEKKPVPQTPKQVITSAQSPIPKAAQDASLAVAECKNITDLRNVLKDFDAISIAESAHHFLGIGNEQAKILILNGMPSADDERSGKLLSGESGDLLSKMLASIGLSLENVFFANSIFWRPPGDRTATKAEIATCLPFLTSLLRFLQPKYILALGKTSSQILAKSEQSLNQIRQKGWQEYTSDHGTIPFMVTYNSSDLLVTPKLKRNAWQDLLKFRHALEQDGLV